MQSFATHTTNIKQYIVSNDSFNIGLRFYYWQKYKELEEIPEEEIHMEFQGTYDAHSGFKVCSLFIVGKYGSFKEEVINYKDEFAKDSNLVHVVMEKAKTYAKDSKVIKAIKAKVEPAFPGREPPYYGIDKDSPLLVEHLLSVLLYCDYTKHSASFSRSFRKTDEFEGLQSIKQRNSKYFWMAKRLRETVEIYGTCSQRWDEKEGKWVSELSGPFYTGISRVINMPYFSIRLCSPTSTTLHIEVAMKFSGQQGMILSLNNPVENEKCRYLRGFGVGAVSRYPEEDEVYAQLFVSVLCLFLFVKSQPVYK